jgi:hypothetical protein
LFFSEEENDAHKKRSIYIDKNEKHYPKDSCNM